MKKPNKVTMPRGWSMGDILNHFIKTTKQIVNNINFRFDENGLMSGFTVFYHAPDIKELGDDGLQAEENQTYFLIGNEYQPR